MSRLPWSRRLPEACSPQLVASILDVHVQTVRRWIRKGYVKAYRVGPLLVRIPRSEVARMRSIRIGFQSPGEDRYPRV